MGWKQWFPNIDHLAKSCTIYAIDLPGAGESSPINYDEVCFEKNYVQPVSFFMKNVLPPDFSMIAHSFSGWLSMRLIEREHIPQSLVLINPVGFTRKIPKKHLALSSRALTQLLVRTVMKPTQKNIRKFCRDVCYNSSTIPPEFINAYTADLRFDNHPFCFIHSLIGSMKLKEELLIQPSNYLPQVPILLIHGKYDPLVLEETMTRAKELLRPRRFYQFQKSGHVPSIEEYQLFNSLASSFIRQTCSS